MRRQLRRDYHEDDLRSEGLRIFTTLHPLLQHSAEQALGRGIEALEAGRQSLSPGSLQGAVVVTEPASGEVLALVGDREPRRTGFNRALDARRPIGSVVKPAVFLTALERPRDYHLATLVDDAAVAVENDNGEVWTPENYDLKSHGKVPLYRALASSYNQATVRLGMNVGVEEVARTLERLGVDRDITPYPSLLLGALSLTPVEVTGMYQTLASGGFKTPLRAIREVTDSRGQALSRYGLQTRPSIDPGPTYILNRALVEAMLSGTGRSVYRRYPQLGTVAGKTGTTNDLRDSWFAGFNADRLAVVWLGRDDNGPTQLTGATGALRVWGDLMAGSAGRPWRQPAPASVTWQWLNPATGGAVAEGCPGGLRLPVLAASGLQPAKDCIQHADAQPAPAVTVRKKRFEGDDRK